MAAKKFDRIGEQVFAKVDKVVCIYLKFIFIYLHILFTYCYNQNAELFTLTYGSIITQLIKDYEDINEVNTQLEKMYLFIYLHYFPPFSLSSLRPFFSCLLFLLVSSSSNNVQGIQYRLKTCRGIFSTFQLGKVRAKGTNEIALLIVVSDVPILWRLQRLCLRYGVRKKMRPRKEERKERVLIDLLQQVGLKMFLGITGHVTDWDAEKKEFSLLSSFPSLHICLVFYFIYHSRHFTSLIQEIYWRITHLQSLSNSQNNTINYGTRTYFVA